MAARTKNSLREVETDSFAPPGPHEMAHVAETMMCCIAVLSSAGMTETAALMRIAHLDLLSRIHKISSEELDALAEIVAAGS